MSEREPAPAAEIESGDGLLRFRLHEDWTWRPAPGPDPPDNLRDYQAMLLEKLRKMGRRSGWGVHSLHHTALAGGKVVRWWGGHSDPGKANREALAKLPPGSII